MNSPGVIERVVARLGRFVRRRARTDLRERGAAVLEAALVLPVFLTAVLGLVDIGYAVFQTSQATSAARDGARAGILAFTSADVAGSTDNAKIQSQVRERLPGQNVESITVTCLSGHTGTTTISCASATPDTDRIRVVVTWTYRPLTPAGAAVGPISITGTATMGIVGAPVTPGTTTTTTSTTTTTTTAPSTSTTSTTSTTTTTVPGSCAVAAFTISPDNPIDAKSNGDLVNAETFTVTTNGAATCTNLQIRYPAKSGSTGPPVTIAMTKGAGNTWTDQVSKNELSWTIGNNQSLDILSSTG